MERSLVFFPATLLTLGALAAPASALPPDDITTPLARHANSLDLEMTAEYRAGISHRLALGFDLNAKLRAGLERDFKQHEFIDRGVRLSLGFSEGFEGFTLGKSSLARLANEYLFKRLTYVIDSAKKNANTLLWSYPVTSFFSLNAGVNLRLAEGGVSSYGGYDFEKKRPERLFTYGTLEMSRFYLTNDGDAYSAGYRFSLGPKGSIALQYRLRSTYERFFESHGLDYSRTSVVLRSKF